MQLNSRESILEDDETTRRQCSRHSVNSDALLCEMEDGAGSRVDKETLHGESLAKIAVVSRSNSQALRAR